MTRSDLAATLYRLRHARPGQRTAAMEDLVALGPEVIPFLMEHLYRGYFETRAYEEESEFLGSAFQVRGQYQVRILTSQQIATLLVRVCNRAAEVRDPEAVAPLITVLRQLAPSSCHAAAARALGAIGDADAVPALLHVLGRDGIVRRQAVEALAQLGPDAVDALLPMLSHGEAAVERISAAEALAASGDPRALPALAEALWDPDPKVRPEVARALGSLGSAAVQPLLETLPGSDSETRRALVRALEPLGEGEVAAAIRTALNGRTPKLEHTDDPRVAQALIAGLGNADADLRARAADALSALGERALARAVCTAVGGDPTALAALGDVRAVAPLLLVLRRGPPDARRRAAQGLAVLGAGAASALPFLERAQAEDEEKHVRDECREAIRAIHAALGEAPAELEAASAPGGTGSELEAALAPTGSGAELEAAPAPDDAGSKARMPRLLQSRRRPRWRFG